MKNFQWWAGYWVHMGDNTQMFSVHAKFVSQGDAEDYVNSKNELMKKDNDPTEWRVVGIW